MPITLFLFIYILMGVPDALPIFMNPVKRERIDRGWTQEDLAERLCVKQSTIAKWEKKGAVYRKDTRHKLAKVFGANEDVFR